MSGSKKTNSLVEIINKLKTAGAGKYDPLAASQGSTSLSASELGLLSQGYKAEGADLVFNSNEEKALKAAQEERTRQEVRAYQQQKFKEEQAILKAKNDNLKELKLQKDSLASRSVVAKKLADPNNYISVVPETSNPLQATASPLPFSGTGSLTMLKPEVAKEVEFLQKQENKELEPLLFQIETLKQESFEAAKRAKSTGALLEDYKKIEKYQDRMTFSAGKKTKFFKESTQGFKEAGIASGNIQGTFAASIVENVVGAFQGLALWGENLVSPLEKKLSKKEQQDYEGALSRVALVEKPFVEKQLEINRKLYENNLNLDRSKTGLIDDINLYASRTILEDAIDEGENLLADKGGADIFAHEMGEVLTGADILKNQWQFWFYDNLVKKEEEEGWDNLSEAEQNTLTLFKTAQDTQQLVSPLQSFGYRTVKGTMNSMAMIRDILLTEATGGVFGATSKMLNLESKIASRVLATTNSPVLSKALSKSIGLVPSTVAQTYLNPYSINARRDKGAEFTFDKNGNITDYLTREALYESKKEILDEEKHRLTYYKKELESFSNLSSEQKEQLNMIKARLGETSLEGIPSIEDELEQYKVDSAFTANIKGIGDTGIERVSELYTRDLFKGLGKATSWTVSKLPRGKGLITWSDDVMAKASNQYYGAQAKFHNTGIGRAYKNWQGVVGKLNVNDTKIVGSMFEEPVEEYVAALGHSLLDWDFTEFDHTLSTEGTQDILAQTALMQAMFGVAGNAQIHAKLKYNTLYKNRLSNMEKKLASMKADAEANPDDSNYKRGYENYLVEYNKVREKASLGILDPTGLVSRSGFSATRNYIDNRKEARKIVDMYRGASKDEDLNKAIDVASLSILGAAQKMEVIAELEGKGKKEEAELVRKSMFRDTIFKAFSTNTDNELEQGLKVAVNNKKLSQAKRMELQEVLATVTELRGIKENYSKQLQNDPDNLARALSLSADIISAKKEIARTKTNMLTLTSKAKEIVDAIVKSKGFSDVNFSMETLLDPNMEFADTNAEKRYEEFKEALWDFNDPVLKGYLNGLSLNNMLEQNISDSIITRQDLLNPSQEVANSREMLKEVSQAMKDLKENNSKALPLKNAKYNEQGELIISDKLVEELYDTLKDKWVGDVNQGKIGVTSFTKLKREALHIFKLAKHFEKSEMGMQNAIEAAQIEEEKSNEEEAEKIEITPEEIQELPLTHGEAVSQFEDIISELGYSSLPVGETPNVSFNLEDADTNDKTNIEAKKADIERKINSLSDDLLFITHITSDNNAINIYNSNLLMPAGVSSTTGIVTKEQLKQILFDLVDGKSPHRGYLDMFIGAINKNVLENTNGKNLQDKLENYLDENFIEDVAKTQLPSSLNIGYFTNGILNTKYDAELAALETPTQIVDSSENVITIDPDEWEFSMLGKPEEYSPAVIEELKNDAIKVHAFMSIYKGQDVSLTDAFEQVLKFTPEENKENAILRMHHFINGWEMAGFEIKEGESLALYHKFTGPLMLGNLSFLKQIEQTTPDMFTNTVGATTVVPIGKLEEVTKAEKVNIASFEEESFIEENMPLPSTLLGEADVDEDKINTVQPKVGFSALTYTLVETEEGGFKKVTTTRELKVGDIDPRPLLNPDADPVMTLDVERVPEDKWDSILVSVGLDKGFPILNEKGQVATIPFSQWVENNKNSPTFEQDFINKVPYYYMYEGKAVGVVHDTDWYNPTTMAHPGIKNATRKDYGPTWENHIQEARNSTSALRQNLAKGLKQVTATKPAQGIYDTWERGEGDLITIQQANPQATMVVQTSASGSLEGLDAGFKKGTKELINTPKKDRPLGPNKVGHTYAVHRVGVRVTDTGEKVETYRAIDVNREVTQETIENLRYVIAAHKILNKSKSDPKYALTEKEVEELRRQIKTVMGLDISEINQLATYIQHFVKLTHEALDTFNSNSNRKNYTAKDVTDKIAYLNIIAENNFSLQEISKYLEQNTYGKSLTNKKGLVLISKEGIKRYEVAPGKPGTYADYLKSTVLTNIKCYDMDPTGSKPTFGLTIQPIITVSYTPIIDELAPKSETIVRAELAAKEAKVELEAEKEVLNIEEVEKYLTETLGVNLEDFEEEFSVLGDLSKITDMFQVTPNLTLRAENLVVNEIVQNIISKLKNRKKLSAESKNKIKEEIRKNLQLSVNSHLKNLNTYAEKLKETETTEKTMVLMKAIDSTQASLSSILTNFEVIYNKAINKTSIITKSDFSEKIKEDNENLVSEENLIEKNYSKDSVEETVKDKASEALRMLLSGIPIYTREGKPKTGFLNFKEYHSLNDVYNLVLRTLSLNIDTEADFNSLISKLETNASPEIKLVVERLKAADEQIKSQFVYNVVAHNLSSKFAMFEELENGFSLKLYDTNANDIVRTLKKIWTENSIASDLYNYDGSINIDFVDELLEEYHSFIDEDFNDVEEKTLRNWLEKVGLVLSDGGWNEIYTKGIHLNRPTPFLDLFKQDKGGLFKPIATFLKEAKAYQENPEGKEKDYSSIGGVSFLEDLNKISSAIATVEAKYNPQLISLSHRDSGKNISNLVPPKFVSDKVAEMRRELRLIHEGDLSDEEIENLLFTKLQKLSFTKDSFLLQTLMENPEAAENFKVHHTALTALKERNTESFGDNSITALDDLAYDQATTAGFSYRRVAKLPDTANVSGFKLRLANMLSLTMSDKGTGLYVTAPVIDFLREHKDTFILDEEGKVTGIKQEVVDILFNLLVLPEIRRMHKFYTEIHATNIQNYDKAVGRFHLLPIMNTLKRGELSLISILKNNAPVQDLDTFLELNQDIFKSAIQDVIRKEVEVKLEQWSPHKEVKETKEGPQEVSKMLDIEYFTSVDMSPEKDYEKGVWDYVMNGFIFNAEMLKVFAGDVTLYSQDKLIKEEEDMKEDENQISEHITTARKIGINLGKRLALMIAPGKKIDGAKNERYNQIILKDAVGIAQNTKYLIEMYYSKTEAAKATPILKKYEAYSNMLSILYETDLRDKAPEQIFRLKEAVKNIEKQQEKIRKELKTNFEDIADFFDIESTDAQEYVTVTEHLHLLKKMGRIPVADYITISETLAAGKDLTKEQLALVLQPMKPVHTGSYINTDLDVNRTVYIKSSAFPLLPQLTRDNALNSLRETMEGLEKMTGRFTRASYQTANKVGSFVTANAINPLDKNDLARVYEGLQTETMEYDPKNINASVLVLNRNNFRIQQDIPFKSDKKKEDQVALGTQIMKMLFGDGIIEMPEIFTYKGKTVDGKTLYQEYANAFAKIVEAKKRTLFTELGLSPEGQITDKKLFISSLQEVLEKEAVARGYSIKSIRGLKIDALAVAATGQTIYDFKTPLWLSADSNRYESLLNAIVTNRVMRHKLPGNGYVAGSESGFKFQESLQDVDASRIIYLDNWNGKELQGTHTTTEETGVVFHKAQVFAPSKFKDADNKLIDLFEGFNYTTKDVSQAKYLKRNANGTLGLKEGVITKELFNLFSFRTPTAAHSSGSSIEIVGILPPENGDLMIVPKHFTKQKGLDFDVDKESGYHLNHILDTTTGKIKVLSQSHLDNELKRFERKLEDFNLEDKILQIKGGLFGFEKVKPGKYANPKLSVYDLKTSLIERFGAVLEDSMSEEDIDILLDPTISLREKMEAKKLQLERKIAENDFIRVYLAVYNSENQEVQKKINKVLSIDHAKKQADKIEQLNIEGEKQTFIKRYKAMNNVSSVEAEKAYIQNENNFNMLTYSYQKAKMNLGAIGKTAIGVYANYSTFNALIEQTFGERGLIPYTPNGPKKIIIGKQESFSYAAKKQKEERSNSEMWNEKVNTATDNEKEQVLGRVGVNSSTINVDALISLRGFDIDENGNSTSYLLLSQPVIKNYLTALKQTQGPLGKYAKKESIIASLLEELSQGKFTYNLNPETGKYMFFENEKPILWEGSKELTGNALLQGIATGGENSMHQALAFMTFLELQEEAQQIAKVQKVVNTNTLGKSIVESNNSYENLAKLPDNKLVPDAIKLLGQVVSSSTEGALRFSYTKETKEGPEVVTNFIIPTSPQGQIVLNGLYLGNNLYAEFFPHKEKALQKVFNLIGLSENENTKIAETEHILEEIKKYFFSNPLLGIFEGDAAKKREELLVDKEGNTSLAKYLSELLKTKNTDRTFAKGIKEVQNNVLLSKFLFEIGKGGEKLSTIKYNNSATDNISEEELYDSLPQLVHANASLPDRNGKPYSTVELVQDLIAEAYLKGGIQEATEYVKFIPVELLEAMGRINTKTGKFSSIATGLKGYNPMARSNFDSLLGFREENINGVPHFVKQYFQHYPNKATRIKFEDRDKDSISNNGSSFKLKDTVFLPSPKDLFISLKVGKNLKLFMNTGGNNYQEIEVLSGKGISQYQYGVSNAKSIIKPSITPTKSLAPTKPKLVSTKGNLVITPKSTIQSVINDISTLKLSKDYAHFTVLASWLKSEVRNNQQIEITNNIPGLGAISSSLKISLRQSLIENQKADEEKVQTFMHEFIHHVTLKELGKYYETDGKTLKPGEAPAHVLFLDKTFNQLREALDPKKLVQFEKWNNILKDKTLDIAQREAVATQMLADPQYELYYAAMDIREFIPTIMENKTVQTEMSKIPAGDKNLWEKVKEAIAKLFASIYPNIKENTLAMEALKASLNFIQAEKINTTENSVSLPFKNVQEVNLPGELDIQIPDQNVDDIIDNLGPNLDTPPNFSFGEEELSKLGISEEDWNELTPEEQQKIKDCN